MTQLMQPPDRGIVAFSPPVTITPAAVATQTGVAVPYPVQAHPGSLGWVIVANSSPYTLQVSQGQALGQVAAFTADVYPIQSGAPLGLLPLAGAGSVVPGSDSTVNLTWYQTLPPGSYPAALGSGATGIAISATGFPLTSSGALAPAQQLNTGLLNAFGYGSATYFIHETTGTNNLDCLITWFDAGGVNQLASKRFSVPAGGTAQFSQPHFGPTFRLQVKNSWAAGNASADVEVLNNVATLKDWGGPYTIAGSPDMLLPGGSSGGLPPGQTIVATAKYTFPGPATLSTDQSTGAFPISWQLMWQSITGAWSTFLEINITAAPGPRTDQQTPVILPAFPIRLAFNNATGGAIAGSWGLVADEWR